MGRNRQLRTFFYLLGGCLLLGVALAESGPKIKLNATGDCVAPVDEMRRNHMHYLFEQRDLVVKHGIRDPEFSLDRCIRCHGSQTAEGQYIPINAAGEFCQGCHAYASVRIDCFECHSTRPARDPKRLGMN